MREPECEPERGPGHLAGGCSGELPPGQVGAVDGVFKVVGKEAEPCLGLRRGPPGVPCGLAGDRAVDGGMKASSR